MTEAGHIQDLLMRLALSHPEVSIQFINNGQEKLRTAGNGKLRDVIYSIYGREVAANLIEMDYEKGGLHMTGFLGKPLVSRGNRNFENFFVNGRYVKSSMISKAIEDAYRDFVMQHKFPFVVLHFGINGEDIDVNVHPTKMKLRFQKQQEVYNTVYEGVHRTLLEPELIPVVDVPQPRRAEPAKEESPFLLKPKARTQTATNTNVKADILQQVDIRPDTTSAAEIQKNVSQPARTVGEISRTVPEEPVEKNEDYFLKKMRERVLSYHNKVAETEKISAKKQPMPNMVRETGNYHIEEKKTPAKADKDDEGLGGKTEDSSDHLNESAEKSSDVLDTLGKAEQMDLFEEKLLRRETKAEYKLIGQVFDTYWLVQFHDNLYIIDQHAAHERVLYERTLREMKNREYTSQYLSPPIILSLTMQEAELLNEHMDRFERIGFEIEPFGGDEYAVRAVPDNLFSIAKKELLMEMLDSLSDGVSGNMTPELIDEKVASMSCKAAVKGNNKLSAMEVDTLIGELLELENPYHCPHGRPTIIAMTKRELEKKFKRIV